MERIIENRVTDDQGISRLVPCLSPTHTPVGSTFPAPLRSPLTPLAPQASGTSQGMNEEKERRVELDVAARGPGSRRPK